MPVEIIGTSNPGQKVSKVQTKRERTPRVKTLGVQILQKVSKVPIKTIMNEMGEFWINNLSMSDRGNFSRDPTKNCSKVNQRIEFSVWDQKVDPPTNLCKICTIVSAPLELSFDEWLEE